MSVKTTVDKDLRKFARLDKAYTRVHREYLRLFLGGLFLLAILLAAGTGMDGSLDSVLLIAAAVIGGYMALNIGANDVANNVGAAVGSGALSLAGALVIAAVMEIAGAMIAGGDVVKTISKGIVDPALIASPDAFVWAMMAALLAAAIWINLATWMGAPVSTTHSIVGGVVGAGIAAAGASAVDWATMGTIAASWVISPALGGIVAAAFLAAVKYLVIFKDDKVAAARRWVPVFVAVMASAFAVYLMMKGLKHVHSATLPEIALVGFGVLIASYFAVRPVVARASRSMENRRRAVSDLFTIPLIAAAALLSFAHGANDVANAIGPLAAIANTVLKGEIAATVTVPFWILAIGAAGIAAGLALYGPKLIRAVGEKITKLDRARAFCIALSAAITVIVASAFGLPVSSTHIALGAIFGVGFFRELLLMTRRNRTMAQKAAAAPVLRPDGTETLMPLEQLVKRARKAQRRRLVRRRYALTIVAAWLVTVPFAGVLAAMLYYMLRGMLLP